MNSAKVSLDRMSTLPISAPPFTAAPPEVTEREDRMTRGQLNRVSRRTARWARAHTCMTSALSIGGGTFKGAGKLLDCDSGKGKGLEIPNLEN